MSVKKKSHPTDFEIGVKSVEMGERFEVSTHLVFIFEKINKMECKIGTLRLEWCTVSDGRDD